MRTESTDVHFPPEGVATMLLAWYGTHGRDLPWRTTRDPYRIWLSEIMLQQTTVTAVIPYYKRFLDRFPDVESLAAASQEEVLELWSGLGYYSRARNLHKAAQSIVTEYHGRFPETVNEIMSLPGVGRSTAGAIVSIAYNQPAAILDGNVRRVLARLMALETSPRERAAEKRLWLWAEALTSKDHPHDYAQAIMDLGATICTPRQPDCENCPLNGICLAKKNGLENSLPVVAKKGALPTRRQIVLVVRKGGQLLVRRRSVNGLLGGMWEFPNAGQDEASDTDSLAERLARENTVDVVPKRIGSVSHVYSHFRLEAAIYLASWNGCAKIAENDAFWHDADSLEESPLHGAHQKVLKLIRKELA